MTKFMPSCWKKHCEISWKHLWCAFLQMVHFTVALCHYLSCSCYISKFSTSIFQFLQRSISADIVFLCVISIYNSFQCFDRAARIPSWIPTCIGTATLMHFLHELTPLVAGHYRSVCTSGPRSANFSWLGVNHKYNPEIWVMSPSASSTHMG